MKNLLATVLLFSIVGATVKAQDKDTVVNRQILESRNYIFKARSASPMRGGMRLLTSDYDLVIKKDTVISWLPYFGRAYSVPLNSSEGGLEFTSSQFEYNLEKKNKHGWEVVIKPKDVADVDKLFLTVYDNGSAVLRVNSINRESISFNGYITAINPGNKKAF